MNRPTQVEARAGFSLWIKYADGAAGEIDLSDLAGRGVFRAWDDRAFFASVRISKNGAIVWGRRIDLCPDALYMRLTGKAAIRPSARHA